MKQMCMTMVHSHLDIGRTSCWILGKFTGPWPRARRITGSGTLQGATYFFTSLIRKWTIFTIRINIEPQLLQLLLLLQLLKLLCLIQTWTRERGWQGDCRSSSKHPHFWTVIIFLYLFLEHSLFPHAFMFVCKSCPRKNPKQSPFLRCLTLVKYCN